MQSEAFRSEKKRNMENTYHCYANRELSWLRFNERVLEEAEDSRLPLCERLSFLSIFQSNLDEFFMVRVGSLYDRTLVGGDEKENKTGMTPAQQLDAIMPKVAELQQHCDKIVAKLYENVGVLGYRRVDFAHLSKKRSISGANISCRRYFPSFLRRSSTGGIPFRFCATMRCMSAPF